MSEAPRITGLILAGGAGRRMQGCDKGLQSWSGKPLIEHAISRLNPQVANLFISANRNLEVYAAYGYPVFPDHSTPSDELAFGGPLCGVHRALQSCINPWLAVVPCDAPALPMELVAQLLASARRYRSKIAIASSPSGLQPLFMLCSKDLLMPLGDFLASGRRKALDWVQSQPYSVVRLDNEDAFLNINT